MRLEVATPGLVDVVHHVTYVRLPASDGSRGVLSGHEPSVVVLAPGAVEVRTDDATSFVVTEGGIATIDRDRVRLVSTWAVADADLAAVAEKVQARQRERRADEAEARGVARRSERATQRALAGLRREVSR